MGRVGKKANHLQAVKSARAGLRAWRAALASS